jgi:IS30 family transposase
MRYRHLIQEERYQISALHEAGWSQQAIGIRLGRHASSISRELKRNRVVGPYQTCISAKSAWSA